MEPKNKQIQTTPAPNTFDPSQIYPTPKEATPQPLSQPQQPPKPNNKFRTVIIFLIIVSVAALGLVAFYAKNKSNPPITKSTPGSFKNISYSNGKGSSFGFTFYQKYITENASSDFYLLDESPIALDVKVKVVAAEGLINGKYPLEMAILSGPTDQNNLAAFENAQDCGPVALPSGHREYQKITDVYISSLKQSATVCASRYSPDTNFTPNSGKGYSNPDFEYHGYFGVFKGQNKIYVAAFYQRYFADYATDPNNLKKFGLQTYLKDVKKIIASISISQ